MRIVFLTEGMAARAAVGRFDDLGVAGRAADRLVRCDLVVPIGYRSGMAALASGAGIESRMAGGAGNSTGSDFMMAISRLPLMTSEALGQIARIGVALGAVLSLTGGMMDVLQSERVAPRTVSSGGDAVVALHAVALEIVGGRVMSSDVVPPMTFGAVDGNRRRLGNGRTPRGGVRAAARGAAAAASGRGQSTQVVPPARSVGRRRHTDRKNRHGHKKSQEPPAPAQSSLKPHSSLLLHDISPFTLNEAVIRRAAGQSTRTPPD